MFILRQTYSLILVLNSSMRIKIDLMERDQVMIKYLKVERSEIVSRKSCLEQVFEAGVGGVLSS